MLKSLSEVGKVLVSGIMLSALSACWDLSKINSSGPDVKESLSSNQVSEATDLKMIQYKRNSELLREMIFVIFNKAPQDKSLFGNYLDTLQQGVSFEGIVRGFTHSEQYRKLEVIKKTPHASSKLLDPFLAVWSELNEPLKTPRILTAEDSRPIQLLDFAEFETQPHPDIKKNKKTVSGSEQRQSANEIRELFKDASPFTMRRVLVELGLEVFDQQVKEIKKVQDVQDKAALVQWYVKTVLKTNTLASQFVKSENLFGLKERHSMDPAFHQQWAETVLLQESGLDRLTWELCNRWFRLIPVD
jgi:hypothetical protein